MRVEHYEFGRLRVVATYKIMRVNGKMAEERAGVMLMAAAGAGNLTLLRHMSLVFESARGERHHENALLAAVLAGRLEPVKILLRSGVDPRALGCTCIQVAQERGHTAILAELTQAAT